MRALMLGWEFPPRRSGGLGTACEGIAKGLVRSGVGVTFVVPSDEAQGIRVVACGGEDKAKEIASRHKPIPHTDFLTIPSPHPPRGRGLDRAAAAAVSDFAGFSSVDSRAPVATLTGHATPQTGARHAHTRVPHAGSADSLRILRVASPLTPYHSRASFAAQAPQPSAPLGAHPEPYAGDLFAAIERYTADVARTVESERFDVIHAHDWMTLPAAMRAHEASRKPLIWHVHSCEYDRRPHDPDAGICALEQLGLDVADRVIVVSRYMAEQLAEHYRIDRSRLRVVHNAVERADFAPKHKRVDDGRPMVLFLGRLTAQKDPLTFLRAARVVVDAIPSARFVVGGSGDLLPHLVDEVKRLDLTAHVHFTGFLDGDDVRRMYALASVYVMPSHSEPFGISALEAMCADVPVIISNATGVAEVLPHALTFERGNAAALAERILSLLERPRLRDELIERGRQQARSLRWDVRARAIARIYREVQS